MATKPAVKPAVNKIQEKITNLSKELFKAKKQKETYETKVKEINVTIKNLEEYELPKLMIDSEIEKISIKGAGTVYMEDVNHVTVLKDDRTELYKWLRANKHGDVITDWVFPGTLKVLMVDLAAKGESLPDIVKVTTIPTAKTRKAPTKKGAK